MAKSIIEEPDEFSIWCSDEQDYTLFGVPACPMSSDDFLKIQQGGFAYYHSLEQAKALRDWLGKFISKADPDMKRWKELIEIPWELRTKENQNELDCLSLKFSE